MAARRPLEIVGVEVNGAGPGTREGAGHALEVAIDWRAHEDVRDFEIEVSISAGGTTAPLGEATTRSNAGSAPRPSARGRARLRLVGVWLAAGDYVVSVALRADGDPSIDAPPSTYALRIEPDSDGRARSLVPLAAGSEGDHDRR